MIKKTIKRQLNKILYPNKYSSDAYIAYLKKNGCKIGSGTYFFNPKTTTMDLNRKDYITIGKNCRIADKVSFIAHDYSWEIIAHIYGKIVPNAGKEINIGDNVFIGYGSTILKGVNIGNNVIIGAETVVSKDIPSNSVCAGNPVRIICSMQQYYEKLEKNQLENIILEAKHFFNKHGRLPNIEETSYFMFTFLERTEENKKYINQLSFKGCDKQKIEEIFMNTQPIFNGYEDYKKNMEKNIIN